MDWQQQFVRGVNVTAAGQEPSGDNRQDRSHVQSLQVVELQRIVQVDARRRRQVVACGGLQQAKDDR